jgi:3-oxoacyl-[acyl-carrier protein] reductase
MDLQLAGQQFIVGGASSGFGKAIAEQLLQEGAKVLGVARGVDGLKAMAAKHESKFNYVVGDITQPACVEQLQQAMDGQALHGILLNAGGPPAKTIAETNLADWDNAYAILLRWKVALVQAFLPLLQQQGYGRILFIESASVKQPMENLVLSNSMRLAVTGFAKSLSNETARFGITSNVLAPGFHNTAAMDRLFTKKAATESISIDAAKKIYETQTKHGRLGEATDFASLASWLLSPASRFVTGQTITVDGGFVQGIFG